ncbi:MAG: hypothetical protein A3J27_02615 [Candidatus Tectomicrobia bacterium RIFCSPLOWO2_12_FULL_69_37]|nr:MAG: hypothetical protein A3I72_10415 [Candidatus Tectomicrobia bacterium RIFCSPLOWO2_02_FULL_70_19]OGL69422.1 MAG: hypothetical protein A3J27_02615 [Candidatus Tectomicrobia bacterium RIFCSPLOWO2_12_FULL_69_37]
MRQEETLLPDTRRLAVTLQTYMLPGLASLLHLEGEGISRLAKQYMEELEAGHEVRQVVWLIQNGIAKVLVTHRMALELEEDVHGAVNEYPKDQWLEMKERMDGIIARVCQNEKELIHMAEEISNRGHKVAGLEELKKKHAELIHQLNWDYTSEAFRKIIQQAEEDAKAGHVLED